MTKKFRQVLEGMSPERQRRIADRTAELLAELPLHELRKARDLSQQELAATLGVNQATISKLERRTDMYISTLRRFVDAMGGELEITARFPEGVVAIDQFSALTPMRTASNKAASAASKTLRDGRTSKSSRSAADSARSQRHGEESRK